MTRFFRLLCLAFGLSLFGVTLLRAAQAPHSSGTYRVLYGDYHRFHCCAPFMVNESRHTANRVRVGVIQQPVIAPSSFSPGGGWRFMLVNTGTRLTPYFVPTDGSPPQELPDAVSLGWQHHWSQQEDVLYYLARAGGYEAALYRVSPSQPTPQRITPFMFGSVRSIDEAPLPTTHFSPWVLLFLSMNVLVMGGGLGRGKKFAR